MTVQNQKKRWNPWPLSIIGFFIVAIGSCVAFVAFCVANPTELVSADYYEQEIRYQSEMERLTRANALGDLAQISYDSNRAEIVVRVPPLHAKEETFSGTVTLYRASQSGMDQKLPLAPDPAGSQSVSGAKLVPGPWQVKVLWTSEGKDYLLDRKIVVTTPAS